VTQEPGRWVEGEEDLGGLDPPGYGHPLDGTAQRNADATKGLTGGRGNRAVSDLDESDGRFGPLSWVMEFADLCSSMAAPPSPPV
jgi:hypothetical protein